jgi:hypothetical protein
MWPWVPAGIDARSDRAGWLPAVSYCSAMLCRQTDREETQIEENTEKRDDKHRVREERSKERPETQIKEDPSSKSKEEPGLLMRHNARGSEYIVNRDCIDV